VILEKNFSGEGYDMDDNELQKIFADGESWPLHWDIRRYLMTWRNESRSVVD